MQVRSEGTNGRTRRGGGLPRAVTPPPSLPSRRPAAPPAGGTACGSAGGGRTPAAGGDGQTPAAGGRHGGRRFNVTLPGRLLRVQRSPPAAPVPPAHRGPPSRRSARPGGPRGLCAEGRSVREGSRRCLQGGPRRRPRRAAGSPKCPQRGSEITAAPRWLPSDAVLEGISKGRRSLGLGTLVDPRLSNSCR